MNSRRLIAIGASSGGVEALIDLVKRLPPGLPAIFCVTLHVPADFESSLPQILSRNGALPATHAKNNELLRLGHIYIAPPDRHLLIRGRRTQLSSEPRENGHRPAIDPMFRSAAKSFQEHVIGVLLSGSSDDGTAGLQQIKEAGGLAVVQDPQTALSAVMPRSALDQVAVDDTVPADQLGTVLAELVLAPKMKQSLPAGNGLPPRERRNQAPFQRISFVPSAGGPFWRFVKAASSNTVAASVIFFPRSAS